MIAVRLRKVMDDYRTRTGKRMTYAKLEVLTGIKEDTLGSIGSRQGYRPGLETIEKICRALDITPGDLLEIVPDPPEEPKPSDDSDPPDDPDAPELPEPPEPPDNPEPPEPPKDPGPPKPPEEPFPRLQRAD